MLYDLSTFPTVQDFRFYQVELRTQSLLQHYTSDEWKFPHIAFVSVHLSSFLIFYSFTPRPGR